MNRAQMSERCPGATVIGTGTLRAYRVTERKWADIDRDGRSNVQGVVWNLTKEHLLALDEYEGYPEGYTRYPTQIVMGDQAEISCIVYEMTDAWKGRYRGRPYGAKYRLTCRQGALENGIQSVF
jgi:gamma-glutamylcyclotransferase (GGCT)/AIG2-like uncharacterized protein YtfP